jgi:hypothetical protein
MTRRERLEAERARLRALMKQQQTSEQRVIADRDEHDACERGTIGRCIDHTRDSVDSCETW